MKMRNRSRDQDEYWVRCPFCGDSHKHTQKAHFSVNVRTGLYHCLRCKESGKWTFDELSRIPDLIDVVFTPAQEEIESTTLGIQQIEQRLLPGPGNSRESGLPRYHLTLPGGKGLVDIFRSLNLEMETVGYYLRFPDGRSQLVGRRLFSFSKENTFETYIRLVEGPYDVVDPRHDLCLFGFPGREQMRELQFFPLVLCPDGDVWTDEQLRSIYLRTISRGGTPDVRWVEVLPPDNDPDDVPIFRRKRKQFQEILQWINPKLRITLSRSLSSKDPLGQERHNSRGSSRTGRPSPLSARV